MTTMGHTPQPPVGLSKREAVTTIHELNQQTPISNPISPPTTTATKTSPNIEHYIEITALVSAHATLDDHLNLTIQLEQLRNPRSPPHPSTLLNLMQAQNLRRLHSKIAAGCIITEAANFATVACWTPSTVQEYPMSGSVIAQYRATRPVFAKFLADIEAAREKYLYPLSARFWSMSLMARDPRREYVPGAVRAVIEPFLEVAREEGVPVWIEAGSKRAREVYAHFGFEEVEVLDVGGALTWCMIRR